MENNINELDRQLFYAKEENKKLRKRVKELTAILRLCELLVDAENRCDALQEKINITEGAASDTIDQLNELNEELKNEVKTWKENTYELFAKAEEQGEQLEELKKQIAEKGG